MANEKPNLDGLAKAGSNAAKPDAKEPTPIDFSGVGGTLIASPPTGSPVDLSSCYGETGRALD